MGGADVNSGSDWGSVVSPRPGVDSAVEAPRSNPVGTLRDLASVIEDLSARGVRFCHWKSNIHLAAALEGKTDLDLLVDRRQAGTVLTVLGEHGLRPIGLPPGGNQPGMSHYLGFDSPTGALFHLHVHYQLVIGQRGVKNYRLPVERRFLTDLRVMDGVPVPAPDVELAMLVVRTLLKYRYRDAVKDALGVRHPGVPTEVRNEVDWLLDQTTTQSVVSSLGIVPPEIVSEFLTRLGEDPRAGFLRLRRRLRKALRPYARLGPVRARMAAARWLWTRREVGRKQSHDSGMKMPGGGLTIALLGADGAGKTTAAEDLVSWLGWKLSVRRYYLGSKEPSRKSAAAYLAFRALRRTHRVASRRFGDVAGVRLLASLRDGLLAVHYVAVAGDRLRRDRLAARDRKSGKVVVLDRCPLPSVSSDPHHRLLDGPQISDVLEGRFGWMARRMVRREETTYARFSLPDVLLALDVDTTVSVGRKPDHLPLVVSQKRRAVGELAREVETQHPEVRVYRVDANQPLQDVRLAIRTAVWNEL